MSRGIKTLVAGAGMAMMLTGSAMAAPVSDGSIFSETFTEGSYPDDPKSAAIGAGANVGSNAMQIITETSTEGVFRASPLGLASNAEYVVEFDWRVNNASGDNFYMYYSQGNSAPYVNDIALRAIPVDASTWAFQVDHDGGLGYTIFNGLNLNQTYHVTMHHKGNVNDDIDLYLDGALLGTFDGRNSSLGTDLVQWGDPSSGSGFGDVTLDNVSIGANVPEPMSMGAVAVGTLALMRRRTSR